MTRPVQITKEVHFGRRKSGRKVLQDGPQEPPQDLGRVPRVSRLLALAIHMDQLCHLQVVTDYADLARLAMVTRARMTQIMNLLLLAPDIQEEILFLPLSFSGKDQITEKRLRPITRVPDWRKQRVLWSELLASLPSDPSN
jgi:hypothetical protein